ncbi:hypothetical protein SYNTR_0946 [Candidatus Syntrophocurvum alkaliphilum]|uniref:Uncharacterized protein n=1 Tax=Candidatus Syntrophocurvum alkaliphilum TaxID=2293317 RepID=A0A6I6DB39_9FIRM|nr:hypothetical protein SYNTR_0946 [Candidatus Syntrophocurvum alkaliphilum]
MMFSQKMGKGSPPHVRGISVHPSQAYQTTWITPACAGNIEVGKIPHAL